MQTWFPTMCFSITLLVLCLASKNILFGFLMHRSKSIHHVLNTCPVLAPFWNWCQRAIISNGCSFVQETSFRVKFSFPQKEAISEISHGTLSHHWYELNYAYHSFILIVLRVFTQVAHSVSDRMCAGVHDPRAVLETCALDCRHLPHGHVYKLWTGETQFSWFIRVLWSNNNALYHGLEFRAKQKNTRLLKRSRHIRKFQKKILYSSAWMCQ